MMLALSVGFGSSPGAGTTSAHIGPCDGLCVCTLPKRSRRRVTVIYIMSVQQREKGWGHRKYFCMTAVRWAHSPSDWKISIHTCAHASKCPTFQRQDLRLLSDCSYCFRRKKNNPVNVLCPPSQIPAILAINKWCTRTRDPPRLLYRKVSIYNNNNKKEEEEMKDELISWLLGWEGSLLHGCQHQHTGNDDDVQARWSQSGISARFIRFITFCVHAEGASWS